MKKHWILASAIVVVVVGLLGGTVFAQSNEGDDQQAAEPAAEESKSDSLASRVAAILGLGAEEVEDAVAQARTDMMNEKVAERLAKAVESGRMTQEDADAYIEWFQARPEGMSPGFIGGPKGKHGRHGRGHGAFGGRGGHQTPPAPATGTSL